MKPFAGAPRRIFVILPAGEKAHLMKYRRVSTGPVTFCGRLDGDETSWRDVKALELCGVCARVSGVADRIMEVVA